MTDHPKLPPTGIEPGDEYGVYGLSFCRTEDKKSLIYYPYLYKPESDPEYEDPNESAFAWQNQEEAMEQMNWMKKIYEVMGETKPTSHPRVRRLVQFQSGTGFPIVEFVPKGNLCDFLRANPNPKVPSGKGSENPLTLKLRWALNVASALVFLHTKSIIFEGLSPETVHLRADLSVALANLDVAAHGMQPGRGGVAFGYRSPDWHESPIDTQPETWITTSQDVFAFGSFLYFLIKEQDPKSFEDEEDMPELEEGKVGEIIRNCWLKGFETMDEVLHALKEVVVEEDLEMNSDEDDIMVDSSVEQFEACGIFSRLIRREEQLPTST